MSFNIQNLSEIIEKTNGIPTIVNESSKFTVVTYWWGRGNLNANTARPCPAFYEDLLKKFVQYIIKLINTAVVNKNIKPEQYKNVIKNIFDSLKNQNEKKFASFDEIIRKKVLDYINSVYDYSKIGNDIKDRDQAALAYLEKLKETGITPANYEFKDSQYLENIIKTVIIESIIFNESNITDLFLINNSVSQLKSKFSTLESNLQKEKLILKSKISFYQANDTVYKCVIEADPSQTIEELTKQLNMIDLNYQKQISAIKEELQKTIQQKKEINTKINAKLKDKTVKYSEKSGLSEYSGKSVFDILITEMQYLAPIKFETMISNWETNCQKNNCNYLAIEYPEFARPGGYQLAINAKPLFIQKALQLCGGRAVLYIDGDMNIRKYPNIFDIEDVDFMARGWWIDPRSSYKMTESIMYDPYLFETSGGTMYFSQTLESKQLINLWIKEAAKPAQVGKADDRVLSLIFNSQKFLCNMKIIQLPIEYLWLTLDYDERLLEEAYDWNQVKMEESIFIDHPECLTSEDTATGAGASSDRTPKYYSFLEELVPVSEQLHEFIMFPNEQMVSSFSSYFDFMNNVFYLDDGNPDLEELGLIDIEDPANNEQPLYITKYSDKYGNKKYPGENETMNEVVDINMQRAKNMNLEGLQLITSANFTEIQNTDNSIDPAKMVSLIIRLLNDGQTVIYNPVNMPGYNPNIYTKIIEKRETIYKNLCFVFNPNIQSFRFSNFFKPQMNLNQAILFRPDPIFIQFLSMFLSLDDFSTLINNGSYEMMSRIRLGYIFPPKTGLIGGGDEENNPYINEYEEGLEMFYNPSPSPITGTSIKMNEGMSGGKKTIKRRNKTNKKTIKMKKLNKRNKT